VLRTHVVLFCSNVHYFPVQYSSIFSVQYFSSFLIFSIRVLCSVLFLVSSILRLVLFYL
jgi:hypothetical protein